MALVTQHVKNAVCVHYMEKCAYKRHEIMRGQSVKHITISCSKYGKMIIPKFCTWQSPKKKKKKTHTHTHTQKHLNKHFINKMVCTPQHKTLYNAWACNNLDRNMKNKHYIIILNKTHISILSKTTKTHVLQPYFNISTQTTNPWKKML